MVETPAPCEFQPDSVSGIKASCDKPVMCGEKSHQHTLYSAEDGGMSGEPAEDREQGQWSDCGGCSAA